MAGLIFSYTDPETGFDYPQAFLIIDDVRVHLSTGLAILGISIYPTQALYQAGKSPVFHEPEFYMTAAEIEVERPKFLSDLYTLLAARPDYSGATIVT